MRTAWFPAFVTAAVFVSAGCGTSTEPPTDADLPATWSGAISRLNAAGYDTQVIRAGTDLVPGLLVNSDPPVLLTSVPPGAKPVEAGPIGPTDDPSGGTLDLGNEHICTDVVASSGGDGSDRTIETILDASGLCGT